VAPTRHRDTCSSNPGVGGIFSLSSALFVTPYLLARQVLFVITKLVGIICHKVNV